jgi:hypothetical protein
MRRGHSHDRCSASTAPGHGTAEGALPKERTPPDLAEYLSRPGTRAYLESLGAEPGMDPATMDMVIALAKVFSPPEAGSASSEGDGDGGGDAR